ncbi:DUF1579 family protein [Leucothrix arctica]|uniref:DUF1579 domain-containing protein n=1 Tax=Leucothrix arctica TaxID=1481894 RepID=A0A317CSE7_9GAMM|nr:DUF1579 family protein [Leucothrix arctica]PWQ99242.1 hypothetical protein DKT75_01465 [Leucothrix arctica]
MTDGIERLHFMVGEWNIDAFRPNESGEWVSSPVPTETRIDSVFDGAFLQEDEVKMMLGDQVVRFFIMWSYDKYRNVYRMVASDDHDGLTDILEGGFNDGTDTIVVSNQTTGTAPEDESGNKAFLRLTSTQNTPDRFTDEMHESYDGGESWEAVYRAIHTRKA